ncbi:MAG: BlaI/MecI/CopY family transcriptional regulator [Eubacteriales bacterium]
MKKNEITQSEIVIMNVIWEAKEATLRMIMDAVCEKTGWTKHTIISFLKRMEQKELISVVSETPVKVYSPLIERKPTLQETTKGIIQNVYNGNLGLLVSNMVSSSDLSDEEIGELIQLLESKKAEK